MLKALADETRWKIVGALLHEPMTVGELGELLGVSQYNVSKHIRILREARIVESHRQGQRVICEVAEGLKKQIQSNDAALDLGCCLFKFDDK